MKSRGFISTVVTFTLTIVVANCQICRPFNKTTLSRACGYNYTAKFLHDHHYHGASRAVEIFTTRGQDNYYKLYECSPYADLIICSLYLPKCVEGVRKPVLPCREVCEEFMKGCKDRIIKSTLEWIVGMCATLPKSSKFSTGEPEGNCFLPPNFNRTTTGYTKITCYPMNISACAGLGYQNTILTPSTQTALKNHMNRTITLYAQKNHTNPKCVEKMRKLICAETAPPCFSGAMYYNCREECENIHGKCSKHFWYGVDMCIEFPKGNDPLGYCKQKEWPRSANWPDFMPTTQAPSLAMSTTPKKTFSNTAKHFTKKLPTMSTTPKKSFSNTEKHFTKNLPSGDRKTKEPPVAVVSNKSPTSPGTIAGVVIAVLVVVLITLVVGLFLYKRHAYRKIQYEKQGLYECEDDTANFEL